MADQPQNSDDTKTTTDDSDHIVHPDGMNPHIVPEKPSDEKQAADDDA